MPRPKTVEDKAILATARELFTARGHAVSTREVAAKVGISQAVLFQRFPTKESLFLAAMSPPQPGIDEIFDLGSIEAPEDSYQRFHTVLSRILDYLVLMMPSVLHLSTHPTLSRDLMNQLHTQAGAEAIIAGLVGVLDELFSSKELTRLEQQQTAQSILLSLHGFALNTSIQGKDNCPETLSRFSQILWEGLSVKESN